MDWLKNRILWILIVVFFTLGLAGVIWNAIPGIIKILLVIGVVCGFFGIVKK